MQEPEIPHSSPASGKLQSIVRQGFQRLTALWATPGVGRVVLCSPFVGFIAGMGAVAFLVCLQAMYHFVLGGLLDFHMPPTLEGEAGAVTYPWPWWLVILVPAVGGLISGILVFTWAPEAEGHGTDAMIRAFHQGGGKIRGRVPLIKSVASIITIGTGGSAGQEGPIAQIGAGFGSYLAEVLKLPSSERRHLDAGRRGRWRGGDLQGAAGRCALRRRGDLFFHGLRVGGAPPVPGQLDRRLLDIRAFHHSQADFQPARPELPGTARLAPLHGPDPGLRGPGLALRSRLLRDARQALQPAADSQAAQARAWEACCWAWSPWHSPR